MARRLCGCSLSVLLLLCASQASGQEPQETVQSLYQTGTEAFDGGRYDVALEAFKSAYALQAAPELLYMVGRSYELNRDYRKALETYRKVHTHSGVSKKTSGYAADGIIKLEALFPSDYALSIAYRPPTAILKLDGVILGNQGSATVRKAPGTYGIELDADGFRPYAGQIELQSNSQVVLTLQERPPAPKSMAPPVPPTHWKRPAGWVALTFGALAGTAGSLFLRQAQDNADAANRTRIATTYDSHKEAAEFNEAMAFSHYGAALVGVGLGILWWVTAPDASPAVEPVPSAEGHVEGASRW